MARLQDILGVGAQLTPKIYLSAPGFPKALCIAKFSDWQSLCSPHSEASDYGSHDFHLVTYNVCNDVFT